MHSFIPTSLPPKRRMSKSQRESSRLLAGFSSHKAQPLESLNQLELLELRDRTQVMLNNSTIVSTLPDGGAKLRERLTLIDQLLTTADDTPETVTEKVSKMCLENNNRPNIRKKSVADANLEACRVNLSSNLLQAHTNNGGGTGDRKDSNTYADDTTKTDENDDGQQAKVRMISLEESVRLQNSQRDQIKEDGYRKQMEKMRSSKSEVGSITDEISATISRLRLDPGTRVRRPDDDNPEDDEDDGDEENDDEDDDDEYEFDSAYEEDDDSIQDEGYVRDGYYSSQYQQR